MSVLMLLSLNALAQNIIVTGTVKDSFGPIIGASVVLVDNSSVGAITDADGKYSINVPSKNSVLEFSFIGYDSIKEAVGDRSVIDIIFRESLQRLNDAVVIGYGTTTVKNLTSAVSSVKTEDLDNNATASVDNMLLGRVAGLNMTSNSAQPGASVDVNIRGSISPNGNNEPLFVIDGVPMTSNTSNISSTVGNGAASIATGLSQSPLATINPSDILSIDVLKDASAAAIYGSASANGVIIITTKRGKEGKPQLTYNGSYTLQAQKPYYAKLMDGKTFMEQQNFWIHEREALNKNTYPYGNVDLNGDGVVDIQDYNLAYGSVSDYYTASEIADAKNFDWLDFITDRAFVTEHNVSLQGGTESTKYFASYNYFLNDGILKNSKLARNTFRMNLDQRIGKRVSIGLNMSYTNIATTNQSSGQSNVIGQGTNSLVHNAYGFAPYVDASFDPELGIYPHATDGQQNNPAGQLQISDKNRNQRVFINPTLKVEFTDDLRLNVVGGFDTQNSRRDYYIPKIAGNYLAPDGMATVGGSESINKSLEAYFNYNKTWGEHRIDATLGVGAYGTSFSTYILQSANFWTDSFGTDNMAAGTDNDQRYTGTTRGSITKLSQFGRVNYTFKDRYIVSATGRRDGSSVFAANKKWGFFPSVSGAWRISDEPWMETSREWLSNLKLRIGYGSSGNEPKAANALSVYATKELTGAGVEMAYALMTQGGYLGGIQLATVANPDLSWETNEMINFGLDFGLWKSRITGSVDYFVRSAKDLLDFKSLPSDQPVPKVISNIGSTQAKGLEFELHSINVKNGDFQWNTDFNFSYTIYRWKTRNPELVLNSWQSVTDEMSAVFGWETDGIFHSYDEIYAYKNSKGELLQPKAVPGNIKYKDYNGDGVLDDKDNHFLGRSSAPFRFGFNNTFTYKRFSATMYWYGAAGFLAVSPGNRGTAMGGNAQHNTYDNGIDKIWSMKNPNGTWPGIGSDLTSSTQRTGGTSDFWYKKIWYAKLRNIQMSYLLPDAVAKYLHLGSLAVSLDAQNLLSLTNYEGYDPEMRGAYPYPICYSFTFGLKATF